MNNEEKNDANNTIVINIDNGSDGGSSTVPLRKVRKILGQYQEDIYDYNGKLDKYRLGKVLTIIDGAISDETQRKAIKDLVHDAWYSARYIDGHSDYPQLRFATEAIGFNLYDSKMLEAMPYAQVEQYNKYKEL